MVLLRGVMLAILLGLFMGCGSPGGEPGDANDPATTSDLEQMKDETGDVN
jgi:hypothetical protein